MIRSRGRTALLLAFLCTGCDDIDRAGHASGLVATRYRVKVEIEAEKEGKVRREESVIEISSNECPEDVFRSEREVTVRGQAPMVDLIPEKLVLPLGSGGNGRFAASLTRRAFSAKLEPLKGFVTFCDALPALKRNHARAEIDPATIGNVLLFKSSADRAPVSLQLEHHLNPHQPSPPPTAAEIARWLPPWAKTIRLTRVTVQFTDDPLPRPYARFDWQEEGGAATDPLLPDGRWVLRDFLLD